MKPSHAHLHAAPPFAALQVLVSQLGPDWEAKVASFDFQPMAAASIGQVGVLTFCPCGALWREVTSVAGLPRAALPGTRW